MTEHFCIVAFSGPYSSSSKGLDGDVLELEYNSKFDIVFHSAIF